jgi:hypothetical protein
MSNAKTFEDAGYTPEVQDALATLGRSLALEGLGAEMWVIANAEGSSRLYAIALLDEPELFDAIIVLVNARFGKSHEHWESDDEKAARTKRGTSELLDPTVKE